MHPSASSVTHASDRSGFQLGSAGSLKFESGSTFPALFGRHRQVWFVAHPEPGAGQSVGTRHSTQLPLEHLGVRFWQLRHEAPQCADDDWMSTHAPLHRPWLVGQLVAHVGFPSVRHPKVQDIDDVDEHVPAPLHSAAVVAMPFVQAAVAPHEVVFAGNTQAVRFVPLHFAPQVPEPAHAVRGVVVATHRPRLLVVAHDSH